MAAEIDLQRLRLTPGPIALALALALFGAVAVAVGPLAGVARVVETGEAVGPVAAATGLATVLGVGAPIVAAVAAWRREWAICLGLLIGNGVVSLALAGFDGQLFADPIDANRFELIRPLTAAPLDAGAGAYCVLTGHLAGLVGAAVAMVALAGPDAAPDDESGPALATRMGGLWSAVTGFAAISLAVVMFPSAWHVTDPVIVAFPALDGSWFNLAGAVLTAAGVLAATASAFVSVTPAGPVVLVGIGVGALSIEGVRLVAGIADSGLDPSGATIVGCVAAAVLAGSGVLAVSPVRLPSLRFPTGPGVHIAPAAVAGVSGIVSAVVIGAGSLLPTITVPAGVMAPSIYATRTVLVAGAVLAIVSVWLLLSEFADLVRPAAGVICVSVLMACAYVMNAVVEAQRFDGVGVGVGALLVGLGVLGTVVTGSAVVVAGADERDSLDRSVDPDPDRRLLLLGGSAAAVGVIGLGLPLYRGTDGVATSFAFPWGWDTWGQIAFAVTLVGVAFVAARARSSRAVALYGGAAVGLAIYLAGWPLTSGRVRDPAVAAGVPVAGLALVLFLAAAAAAVRSPRIVVRGE